MHTYRMYSKWRLLNEKKANKILKKNKKLKVHYIPTRDWYIISTDEEWEQRKRLTINEVLEAKI